METLVALVVASLFLSAFGRALSGAWSAARTPMDVVSAALLARAAARDVPSDAFRDAVARGYAIDRSSRPVDLVVEESGLAPAPASAAAEPPEPHSTPAGMQLAEPKGLVPAGGAAKSNLALRHMTVLVKTPLGRRLRFDSIKADDAQP